MLCSKVESMHDSIGRVLVKMALGGKSQSICEYMLELVNVKEYNDKSKLVSKYQQVLFC